MEPKRFLKGNKEYVAFSYSNNKRWCVVSCGNVEPAPTFCFITEKEATDWVQKKLQE